MRKNCEIKFKPILRRLDDDIDPACFGDQLFIIFLVIALRVASDLHLYLSIDAKAVLRVFEVHIKVCGADPGAAAGVLHVVAHLPKGKLYLFYSRAIYIYPVAKMPGPVTEVPYHELESVCR